MKTYRFCATVEQDGTIHLSGLPPQQKVEIVVVESTDLPEDLQNWLDDVRSRHPFAQMSKDEVLEVLRQTRESVWAERHESQLGHKCLDIWPRGSR